MTLEMRQFMEPDENNIKETLLGAKLLLHQLRPKYRREEDADYHGMIDVVIEKIDNCVKNLPNPQNHSE